MQGAGAAALTTEAAADHLADATTPTTQIIACTTSALDAVMRRVFDPSLAKAYAKCEELGVVGNRVGDALDPIAGDDMVINEERVRGARVKDVIGTRNAFGDGDGIVEQAKHAGVFRESFIHSHLLLI